MVGQARQIPFFSNDFTDYWDGCAPLQKNFNIFLKKIIDIRSFTFYVLIACRPIAFRKTHTPLLLVEPPALSRNGMGDAEMNLVCMCGNSEPSTRLPDLALEVMPFRNHDP